MTECPITKNWAIEGHAKDLNLKARLYDEWAFRPFDITAIWLSHLALALCMLVVVNFNSQAQASGIRIERRQVVFLCWMQASNLEDSRHLVGRRLNAQSQTDWAIKDQVKHLNSTARPYDEWAFSSLDFTAGWHSHLALAIYMSVVVNFDALAQARDIRIERKQVVFLCWMPAPMMSEHLAQLTSLPIGFCTWLWPYTCLLLLISMLWHR